MRDELGEHRAKALDELAFDRIEARVVESPAQELRPELDADELLVQVLPRPVGETGVDRLVEAREPFRDRSGGSDHDHHDHVRLEQQHLDVPHRFRLQRRRRDEREQARRLGEHLGRRLQRRLDLPPRLGQVEIERRRLGLEPLEQRARVVAVAAVRRHPSRGGVRVRQQPDLLELGELAPDRGRRDVHARPLDQALRAHGLARRHVLLDDPDDDLPLALGELDLHVCRHFTPAARL